MIKTYCGEMIEPRVGDVVLNGCGKFNWTVDEDNFCGHCLESCTLLHRPFQVGDEVEVECIDDSWKPLDHRYGDKDLDAFVAAVSGLRHKNPAWRDHPDRENNHE